MGEKRARGSVAVVIPCFNDGATLVDAVASAQSQDLPAEIIVVDDGSTDQATRAVTYRNGLRTLIARYRAHRMLRAECVLRGAPWYASPDSR